MFTGQDKKLRFLRRLSKSEKLDLVNTEEIDSLLEVGNFTQAFLTQWMVVEKTAKHLAKVGVICIWCDKTFESLHKALGDVGYKQVILEKKIFDTLYTKYAESRSSGFDKINIDQLKKVINILDVPYEVHDLTVLLASNPDGNSDSNSWPNHQKKSIRKVRNGLIHSNGRIASKTDYDEYLPYFEKYFVIIADIAQQIESLEKVSNKKLITGVSV